MKKKQKSNFLSPTFMMKLRRKAQTFFRGMALSGIVIGTAKFTEVLDTSAEHCDSPLQRVEQTFQKMQIIPTDSAKKEVLQKNTSRFVNDNKAHGKTSEDLKQIMYPTDIQSLELFFYIAKLNELYKNAVDNQDVQSFKEKKSKRTRHIVGQSR